MKIPCLLGLLVLVSGCALNRPDHFYVLAADQRQTLQPKSVFATEVTLRVTLPALVDRREMVLMNQDGVRILEHERWGAPLSDQVTSVLGQDIEARREDVIITARHIAQTGVPNAAISVDVVQLQLRQGSGVRLEARWRLDDDGKVFQGRETFTAPAADGSYRSMAGAIDACLGLLADRLVADLPR